MLARRARRAPPAGPAWSPKGDRIAAVNDGGGIELIDPALGYGPTIPTATVWTEALDVVAGRRRRWRSSSRGRTSRTRSALRARARRRRARARAAAARRADPRPQPAGLVTRRHGARGHPPRLNFPPGRAVRIRSRHADRARPRARPDRAAAGRRAAGDERRARLAGEPGIGKTALLEHAVERAAGHGRAAGARRRVRGGDPVRRPARAAAAGARPARRPAAAAGRGAARRARARRRASSATAS